MGKPQKRKGNYHNQHRSKKGRYGNKLDAGMRGILITCNKREREALREAYNLLSEYADKLYGPEKTVENEGTESLSDGDEEEDIETALKREVNSLKKTKPSQRRFQQMDTGTTNVVFIRTTLEDPTDLVHAIFTDTLETQQSHTRFILRMYPVLGTCSAYDDRITDTATKVLESIFSHGQPTTYASQIKVRNNSGISRTSLLPVLGRVMEVLNRNARVDFAAPEFIVNVDVLKTVACISCLRDFNKFRKYNIQEVVVANRTVNRTVKGKAAGQDEEKGGVESGTKGNENEEKKMTGGGKDVKNKEDGEEDIEEMQDGDKGTDEKEGEVEIVRKGEGEVKVDEGKEVKTETKEESADDNEAQENRTKVKTTEHSVKETVAIAPAECEEKGMDNDEQGGDSGQELESITASTETTGAIVVSTMDDSTPATEKVEDDAHRGDAQEGGGEADMAGQIDSVRIIAPVSDTPSKTH